MMKSWRKKRTWKDRLSEEGFNFNPSPYPPTKIFDNLIFIGDETVNCFLLETSAGPALIDLMWPGKKYRETIERGLGEFGYKSEELSAMLITHGHIDHYGDVEYFRQKSGAPVYMTETDCELAKNFVPKKAVPENVDGVAMTLNECEFVEDMQDIVVGDTVIKAVLTPGHTPAGLSFIFPVYDEGRRHTAAMWGGNTVPGGEKDVHIFLSSLEKFSRVCDEMDVDVELSNHPFVDNSIERLNLIRNICNGVPNPFVIGKEAYKRYEQLFVELALQELKEKYCK